MLKKTRILTRLSLLIALTLIIQLGGFPQLVTGPLINSMFFITTYFLGLIPGILIGLITPVVAIIRGLLPPPLAAMIPFIALSNGIMVLIFYLISTKFNFIIMTRNNPIKNIKLYIAILIAAIIKFMILAFSVKIILPVIISQKIPQSLIIAMTTPQLITAIFGGIIALLLAEILYRTKYEFK